MTSRQLKQFIGRQFSKIKWRTIPNMERIEDDGRISILVFANGSVIQWNEEPQYKVWTGEKPETLPICQN